MAVGKEDGLPDMVGAEQRLAAAVPLIAEHDSWITVDPIIGCPADCPYCYLGPLGLRNTRSYARAMPSMVAAALVDYLTGRRSVVVDPSEDLTPICLGNYTDMVISRPNRDSLVNYLRAIIDVLTSRRPLVLITKGRLDRDLVDAIDGLKWPVIWFFSQSMAAEADVLLERGPVARFVETIDNIHLVGLSTYQQSIHFWRPFVRELRLTRNRVRTVIGSLSDAGCAASVVVGLKRGPGVPLSDERLRSALGASVDAPGDQHEVFDQKGWQVLQELAEERSYPVHRMTKCALTLVAGRGAGHRCSAPSCARAVGSRRSKSGKASVVSNSHIAEFLGIPVGRIETHRLDCQLTIDAAVGEHDFNVLLHAFAAEWDIRPRRVIRQKAWLGAAGERYEA